MPSINIHDSNGTLRGFLVRAEFSSGTLPDRMRLSTQQMNRFGLVASGPTSGNFERMLQAFPDMATERGSIIPGMNGTTYYQPIITGGSHDVGTLYAINKIFALLSRMGQRPIQSGGLTLPDVYARMDALIERLGGWSILDRSIIEYLNGILASPDVSISLNDGYPAVAEYDDSNMIRLCSCVHTAIVKALAATPVTRKILRRNNMMSRAWAAEMCLAIYQNMNASAMTMAHKDTMEILEVGSLAIKDYGNVRGSRLDDSDRGIPQLTRVDAVRRGFNTFNERVSLVYRNLMRNRVSNGKLDFSSGGPAFEFNGYRVNVLMAYGIMDKVIGRMNELHRNGNTHNHLDGNFWVNGDVAFPIIAGSGNNKHMQVCRLIQDCARHIARHYPVSTAPQDGNPTWTADIGEEHADISVNATINAGIKTCSSCGVVSTGNGGCMIKHGESYLGRKLVNPGNPSRNYCESCLTAIFARPFDADIWMDRNRVVQIDFSLHRNTGERTQNSRAGRVSPEFFHLIEGTRTGCNTCGSLVFDPALLSAFVDHEGNNERQELVRSLANGIPANSELGNKIGMSVGRGPSTDSHILRLNQKAEIWDSGTAVSVCPRCSNLNGLFRDDATGRYYSSIDNSPMAPEYGYKVPDPDGRWLPRCLGIEFETGPGSSRANGKDEFLNSRCSDDIHIWNIHSDGSLMTDACEITTPPVGGLAIKMAVDAMFELARTKGFYIENRQAGMHIHTDITDMFSAMFTHRNAWLANRNSVDTPYHKFCKQFSRFGDALAMVSRQFVSAYRRGNQYCNGGFGIRSWNIPSSDPMSNHESQAGSGRQAVCVHCHNGYSKRTKVTYTLENRIWPSSNSKEYTLARAELTQKAVDKFVSLAIPFLEHPRERASLDALTSFVDAFADIAPFYSDGRRIALDKLVRIPDLVCGLLGISDDGREALVKLHKRFFFISYYAHEHSLTMNSPEITALRRESLTNSGTREEEISSIQHAEEVAGIMLQKGFGDIRAAARNTPLASPSSMVVMDTLLSSTSTHPITTDQSDLSTEAPLSRVHH